MSKNRGKIVNPDQVSLFDTFIIPESPQCPGSFDIETRLKEEASLALRKCRLSRYQVAAKMSEDLGYDLTKTMLDNHTAESKENVRWPAAWLAPFAIITGHYEQIKLINKLSRMPVADSEMLVDMEIERRRKVIEEEEKELNDLLRIKGLINGNGRK